MLAYQELLRHHNLIQPLRLEARKVLESIYREHLPQLAADFESVMVQTGTIDRYSADYSQHVTDTTRVGFFARADSVTLEPSGQFRADNHLRYEAGLRLELWQSRRWASTYWLGGGDSGPIVGASVTRTFAQQRFLTLESVWNERATDGLLAEALNSRQHRVSLKANYLIRHSWLAYGEVLLRKTVIQDEQIAEGWGVNGNFEYILFHQKPELRFGYHAQWNVADTTMASPHLLDTVVDKDLPLDQKQAILSSLFLRQNHRHGVYYDLRYPLSGALYLHTNGGLDYVFEQKSIEWYASAGFSFFPRKSVELKSGIGYATSAKTRDFASDQWILSGGLKWYF